MKSSVSRNLFLIVFAAASFFQPPAFAAPIKLHPSNPHYFLWRGKPTVLITSGEHYGAVMNLDFNYRRYLDVLAAEGMMLTRTFSGSYLEPEGAFNIARNTMAPAPGRFICPWARSDQTGFLAGGNKFDLARWDEAYFKRLRDFVGAAARHGIVIEFTLFCPMYEEKQWNLSPMNVKNNVNGIGAIGRNDVHTLDKNGRLLEVQEMFTRRVVRELNAFDNVMFEICNEPYFGGVTMAWQHRIADIITETERSLPKKHLITQNIANNQAKIENPHPQVSVFNFHYATPPDAVGMNYQLNKVIGDNETGFRGTNNAPYRTEAWDFIIEGGGLYNNLDYSFVVGKEDGTFRYPASQPGGGNPQFRRELKILRDFIHGFNFLKMRPDKSVIKSVAPATATARALVDPANSIAIYVRHEGTAGPWSARWTGYIESPTTGEYTFHTLSNDGIRLWVNGQTVLEDWSDHGEKEDSGKITLEAGKRHSLKLEYFYNGGQGVSKLWWTPPGGKKEPVPANAFRLPDKDAWGLRGEYFRGTDLKNTWATRDDGMVNFAWGVKPPFSIQADAGSTTLQLALPEGHWTGEWLDTKSGKVLSRIGLNGGTTSSLGAPPYETDIALRLLKN